MREINRNVTSDLLALGLASQTINSLNSQCRISSFQTEKRNKLLIFSSAYLTEKVLNRDVNLCIG